MNLEKKSDKHIEEIRTLDGGTYHRITSSDGSVTMHEIFSPYKRSTFLDSPIYADLLYPVEREFNEFVGMVKKGGDREMNIVKEKSADSNECIVICSDEKDLSVKCVLTTLSAMKGKLMLDMAPFHVESLECRMTPAVRTNIITASKKLKMYGKKRPVIARFDEYGNRLPDEIKIDSEKGITLKLVDPEVYNKFYFELRGIKSEPSYYYTSFDDTVTDDIDLPF